MHSRRSSLNTTTLAKCQNNLRRGWLVQNMRCFSTSSGDDGEPEKKLAFECESKKLMLEDCPWRLGNKDGELVRTREDCQKYWLEVY